MPKVPTNQQGQQHGPQQQQITEEQNVSHEDVKQLQLIVHTKNQESKAKDVQLEENQRELQALRHQLAAKSENKSSTETHLESAKRRLTIRRYH